MTETADRLSSTARRNVSRAQPSCCRHMLAARIKAGEPQASRQPLRARIPGFRHFRQVRASLSILPPSRGIIAPEDAKEEEQEGRAQRATVQDDFETKREICRVANFD